METLGPALVTGAVGLVAAFLSYAAGSRESRNLRHEAAATRRHSQAMTLLERELASGERLWRLLFKLEADGDLSEADEDDYIVALMWLRPTLRDAALKVLPEPGEKPSQERITSLRHQVLLKLREEMGD